MQVVLGHAPTNAELLLMWSEAAQEAARQSRAQAGSRTSSAVVSRAPSFGSRLWRKLSSAGQVGRQLPQVLGMAKGGRAAGGDGGAAAAAAGQEPEQPQQLGQGNGEARLVMELEGEVVDEGGLAWVLAAVNEATGEELTPAELAATATEIMRRVGRWESENLPPPAPRLPGLEPRGAGAAGSGGGGGGGRAGASGLAIEGGSSPHSRQDSLREGLRRKYSRPAIHRTTSGSSAPSGSSSTPLLGPFTWQDVPPVSPLSQQQQQLQLLAFPALAAIPERSWDASGGGSGPGIRASTSSAGDGGGLPPPPLARQTSRGAPPQQQHGGWSHWLGWLLPSGLGSTTSSGGAATREPSGAGLPSRSASFRRIISRRDSRIVPAEGSSAGGDDAAGCPPRAGGALPPGQQLLQQQRQRQQRAEAELARAQQHLLQMRAATAGGDAVGGKREARLVSSVVAAKGGGGTKYTPCTHVLSAACLQDMGVCIETLSSAPCLPSCAS